jgi:hypothetical protein
MRRSLFIFLLLAPRLFSQTWQQLPSFPGTPRDDAASFTIGDHIYVGTGMEVGWGLTSDWWRFDMISEAWESVVAMPATPRQYCTTFTILDTGYVFGGLDGDGALNELWAYSPSTGWVQKASLPAEARYACVGQEGLYSGVIATGMLASGSPTAEAWKYRPQNDSWEQLADVPGPPRHRAASVAGAAGMLLCGGADADFSAMDDCWSYPLWFEVGQWFEAGQLPAPRYGHKGATEVVMIGGASDTFDMHADVWNIGSADQDPLPSFPGGPRRGGVAFGRHAMINSVYFGMGIGPEGNDFIRHNDWWKLTWPVGITELEASRPSIFPNPVTDRFTIRTSNANVTSLLGIWDVCGRELSITEKAGEPVDIGHLRPGRYTVLVRVDGIVHRLPLIKIS